MTLIRISALRVERALATALLIVGLLMLFAVPSASFAAEPDLLEAVARSCDPNLYITGDMVGNGNPAEVYAVLCG
jgi:hypothetical protein